MNEFLKQCARHYYDKGDLQKRLFVFPNRRSMLHFGRHIANMVKEDGDTPLLMPQMLTMNDFFFKATGMQAADKVTLLLELYTCYSKVYPAHEPLDEFIFWGDVLLSDFDDVDKYLVDARGIFHNISDLKNIQDDFEYLTETQRKAIERFIGHFRNSSGRLSVRSGTDSPNVKERFLKIWDILLPLYAGFRKKLEDSGKAYEGMVYRKFAEMLSEGRSVVDVISEIWPRQSAGMVFIGLNALNECEKKVMSRLRDAGLAEFCWDYSSDLIRSESNKSSLFLSDNVKRFPQAFRVDPEDLPATEISVISVPSSIGQAKQIPQILESIPENQRGIDTAIVLPDEGLLMPTLNSIPSEIKDINVTMGIPMHSSMLWALIYDACLLQLHLREKDGHTSYHHKQVWSICSNSLLRSCMDEESMERINEIRGRSGFFVPEEEFAGIALLESIFKKAENLTSYLKQITRKLSTHLRDNSNLNLELDFAMELYKALNQLESHRLEGIRPAAMVRLINQLAAAITVPFTGEPLKGLQIMGPLETRSLDFKNLVILSCNEGLFPRRSVSSSFIPPELRKGFGLPTYEFQDAVWAYYFYRMIQRCTKVWLMFDSRTEGIRVGEESRFIKQLELDFNIPVKRYVAKAPAHTAVDNSIIIKKAEDIEKLKKEGHLSASSLQSYLACPAQFYYQNIAGLRNDDEISDSLDSSMIGNIYHKTMQALYLGPFAMDPSFDMDDKKAIQSHAHLETVDRKYLREWIGRKKDIRARIHSLIAKELKTTEVTGRNIIFENVECEYVINTLKRDLEHLDEKKSNGYRILGLEKSGGWEFEGFHFYGIIDRLDSMDDGTIRVVDYKTGKVMEQDVNITDDNASSIAEKLFGEDNENRPKISLQIFLYDKYISSFAKGKAIINSIYPASGLFVQPVCDVPANAEFGKHVEERLKILLDELQDISVPFEKKGSGKTCEWCSFKIICGK